MSARETQTERREPVLVAVAWPYANGPLHLGHVAGSLLPPDVFARYQRLRGRDVLMVSGSDMHGTPITVAAEKQGREPEELAREYNELHKRALEAMHIRFDLFTSTATENHKRVVHDVFLALHEQGYIEKRPMTAPYDPQAGRFLPDRYVEGECPHCGFADARGDQCDNCGRTLDPQELINPRSMFSGTAPEFRETEHYFLLLTKLQPRLKQWVEKAADEGDWRPTVRNFTENWLREGLKDRAITRDITYGVPIPAEIGEHPDKRIYVWFEAVVGYLSAAKEWAGDTDAWERFWLRKHDGKAFYFLGKDNIPFHTIIWPAMLLGYNEGKPAERAHNLPFDVPANEFLQFAGAKFSKSRGNAFYVLDLLDTFDADAVRYYLSVNMPEQRDTNWTWEDFVAKVNDELVATIGNYANRVLTLTQKNYEGIPAHEEGAIPQEEWATYDEGYLQPMRHAIHRATDHLEARHFKAALREIYAIAQLGNRSIDAIKPWALVKEDRAKCGNYLLSQLSVLKTLSVLLQPYLPAASEALWKQLGDAAREPASVQQAAEQGGTALWPTDLLPVPKTGGKLGDVQPLFKKLDLDEVLATFEPAPTEEAPEPEKKPMTEEAGKPNVTYDDFAKLDLRVGHVKSVENHPNADKLYVLKVDLGTEERQILAGLREHVKPDEIQGKRVIVIANLEPRKIRGLESQGMLLAAESGDTIAPLTPAKDVPPGATIR